MFGLVGDMGRVALPELEKTFNMGVGMIAMVAPELGRHRARAACAARGVDAWVLGEARARAAGEDGDAPAKGGNGGAVSLVGTHAH